MRKVWNKINQTGFQQTILESVNKFYEIFYKLIYIKI
jgi:hypothetical protein